MINTDFFKFTILIIGIDARCFSLINAHRFNIDHRPFWKSYSNGFSISYNTNRSSTGITINNIFSISRGTNIERWTTRHYNLNKVRVSSLNTIAIGTSRWAIATISTGIRFDIDSWTVIDINHHMCVISQINAPSLCIGRSIHLRITTNSRCFHR